MLTAHLAKLSLRVNRDFSGEQCTLAMCIVLHHLLLLDFSSLRIAMMYTWAGTLAR